MSTKELFLELGTEEIPAGFIPRAMAEMEAIITRELTNARLSFSEVKTLATPRPPGLDGSKGIPAIQPDAEITATGPSKKAAYRCPNGKPTKAAEGFARWPGGVMFSAIQIVTTDKGEYISITRTETGRPTHELLSEILPKLINEIPFKKSMRWGDLDVRFARPIHWIVALFDGGRGPPSSFGNITSGAVSQRTPLHGQQPLPVCAITHTTWKSVERHFVIPDPERRKEIIRRENPPGRRSQGRWPSAPR